MGNPTGFLEYERQPAAYRPPEERIRDWDEFTLPLSEERQRRQAARCMNCGVPFCHAGELYNRAVSGCPNGNLIPEWNELLYLGLYREAWDRLARTNPLPEMTSRVCPAPCEGACTNGLHGEAVTIRYNERFIVEKAFEEGWVAENGRPLSRTGRRVAVVGSGPSGLACAWTLNRMGHWVTVYERADRPGGLLMYGIPNMKLDKRVVERRVEIMKQVGITFVTGAHVGVDLPAARLEAEYDAVVLCGGSTRARDLNIPGRQYPGIELAVDYLTRTTRRLLEDGPASLAGSLAGKRVVIIGGGDTGNDCVGTAIRRGAENVIQFEIMPAPPERRAPGNPWPEWPAVRKTDYGQQEAIYTQGEDPRIYCINSTAFAGDEKGVTGIDTVLVRWEKNDAGRFAPVPRPGTEKRYPADLVLLAMGFTGPEETLLRELGVTPGGDSRTGKAHIFTAGDMRRGQSLVIWAIQEGRQAAQTVDEFLISE